MDDTEGLKYQFLKNRPRTFLWNDHILINQRALYPPHYLLPKQNLHSSVSIRDLSDVWYRKPFPYSSSYHLPFLPPNKIDITKFQEGDPIANLVKRKLLWEDSMVLVQKSYKSHGLNFDTIEQAIASKLNLVKVRKYEGYILHMLKHDPDPHFTGLTNWWHTGGRVCYNLIGGQMVLLTSSGEDNENLYVVPISDDSGSWKAAASEAIEFPTSSSRPIYQIVSSNRKSGRHNLLGVRQRNVCTILSLELTADSFQQREDKCWEVRYDEAPFTSLDFNPFRFGSFSTASVERQVSVWDAKKCCCVSSHFVRRTDAANDSQWCSLQHFDANTVVMADASTLMLLDIRQPFDKPSLVYSPFNQEYMLDDCEEISLVLRSSSPSASGRNVYFATRHHLLTLDLRSSEAVQCWTHMLRSSPLYGHCAPAGGEGTELVCLGNQETADVSLVVNEWSGPEGTPRSAVFPYAPPSLHSSRSSAQLSGRLLDPRAHSRMKVGLAGITILLDNHTTNHSIVTQTSTGDVFIQELRDSKEEPAYTKTDLDELKNWEEQVLESRTSGRLKLTSLYRFKSIVRTINNPEHRLPRYKRKIRFDDALMIPTSELVDFKDILAAKLLEAWGFERPETEETEDVAMLRETEDTDDVATQKGTEEQAEETPGKKKKKKKKRKRNDEEAEQEQEVVDVTEQEVVEVTETPPSKKKKRSLGTPRTSVAGF